MLLRVMRILDKHMTNTNNFPMITANDKYNTDDPDYDGPDITGSVFGRRTSNREIDCVMSWTKRSSECNCIYTRYHSRRPL